MPQRDSPDTITCGRCGQKKPPHPGYTNLCTACRVPHQLITRTKRGVDHWRCGYCGQTGSFNQLQGSDCIHDYARCEACGEHPYCAPDCRIVHDALAGSPKIGF